VIQDGRDIGRIFKPRAGVPPDHPWMWTITGAVAPRLPSHGFCASLDEAKAKFAEIWRAWLALLTDRSGRTFDHRIASASAIFLIVLDPTCGI
jgi:hypothetical protein